MIQVQVYQDMLSTYARYFEKIYMHNERRAYKSFNGKRATYICPDWGQKSLNTN